MSETWPTNAALKREHDRLLAELQNTRSDLNGTHSRLVEVDDQLQAVIDELRQFKQHVSAEFARLAGETETGQPAAPQELEPAVEATARTLTYLAGWIGTDQQQAQLREIARAVRDIDTRDICCPVCQEIQCDDGCPLYEVRLSWGCFWGTTPGAATVSPGKAGE